MMDRLPIDIWIQIFVRLPAKTILRCLSVCKSWKLSIQHPSFINFHLQHQTHDLMLVRYIREDGSTSYNNLSRKKTPEVYSLHIDDESFSMHANYEFPILHLSGECYRVVGSCNGIICITDDQLGICHDTYLWNPTIQKCIELPRPMFTFDKIGGFDHELGFGFDEKTNDYKVVRIVDPIDIYGSPLEVEIYSLSSGIWRKASHLALKLGVRIFGRLLRERDRQVNLNGAVHWLGFNRRQPCCMVIAFNLSEEVFRCFELPIDITVDYYLMRKLRPVVFQGALSLIEYREERCGMWVMKDYGDSSSWSKHLDITLSEQVERVIGIRNKGGLLIEIYGGLYSYDPEAANGKKFTLLDERDLLDWKRLQEGHMKEPFYLPRGYVPRYNFVPAIHMGEHDYFLQKVPDDDFEVSEDMEEHFHFPEHVRNYDPKAAPKDLGIRSKTREYFRFSFHCERHIESLVLLGSANCAEMSQVESKESESERTLEEGNSVAGLMAEPQHRGEEEGKSCDKMG